MPKTGLNKFINIFVAAEKAVIWVKVLDLGDPQVLNAGSCEDLPVLPRVRGACGTSTCTLSLGAAP